MKRILTAAALASIFPMGAMAQTERDLDSHVHGAAALNLALTGDIIIIELDTPWNNLVGFEYQPKTDAQLTAAKNALEKLNDPTQLFAFNAGDCSLISADISNNLPMELAEAHNMEEHESDHGDEHAHNNEHEGEHKDEHDHDAEHEGEHKDEHSDQHAEHEEHAHDEHESETSHSSVLAMYEYECADAESLSSIDTTLFSVWPSFEKLTVQMLSDSGHSLLELTADNTVIDLK